MTAGTLFVVATPIGNLDDLTVRAARVLSQEASLVVAEDTRRSRVLLNHVGAPTKPIRRLDAHATSHDIDALVETLARGETIALVTDAGTPAVSDPGPMLVRAARARGIKIVPLPGASAVTTALSASGYPFSSFRFVGFLPRSGVERTSVLQEIAADLQAVVIFEAPSRLIATLQDLAAVMPDRRVLVARELTKLHEELVEGELAVVTRELEGREIAGELTLVLGPWAGPTKKEVSEADLDLAIDRALDRGGHPKAIAEELALTTGLAKRDIYSRVVHRKRAR